MKTKDTDRKYPLILIQWVDAESDCEWTDPEKIEEWANDDCTIHEIGWLISETKKYVVITNQITYDGVIGNKTKVPVKWIKHREILKISTPRKKKSLDTH